MGKQRVAVIGAGIGGLTAAALLAARGQEVVVFERASTPGGKMRTVIAGGRPIDVGPTVFTMRWVFDEIFAAAGTALDDHLTLQRADILARHAWSVDERLDLHADLSRSADAIGRFAGAAEARRFLAFSAEAKRIYETLKRPFLCAQRPNPVSLVARSGLSGLGGLMRIKPFETMWSALGRHFGDRRLRQLFGRYATYCGSSPFEAPATLMLVAHVEQDGVWTIAGGMHKLAQALAAVAERAGAAIRYDAEVSGVEIAGDRVGALKLANGETFAASDVIVNADANAIASGLLGSAAVRAVPQMMPSMRSLSAISWAMAARTKGFPLTRHNVFFSSDYRREFAEIAAGVPDQPTVYVCAQDRDGSVDGEERLLCLVNARASGDTETVDAARVENAMRRRLANCGLEIEWQRENSVVTTPADFARMFPATGGALYGRASHGWMASFQRPAATTRIPGLYLAGGSVHPGPGVPMAALSGRLAAESLLSSRASM
jgi:1-hydroxycarotenoid 3,4-desaturase